MSISKDRLRAIDIWKCDICGRWVDYQPMNRITRDYIICKVESQDEMNCPWIPFVAVPK